MSIKSSALLLGLMALAVPPSPGRLHSINVGGGEQELSRYRKSKGIQKFTIDGITVYARDYKNALRKAKNILASQENNSNNTPKT